jgi:Ca2+-binding EF-hand superfamily protein
MGCSESLVEGHVHVPPMNHELLTHFHSLKWTTSDVRKLYLVFATIDVVKDKKIGLDELLAYLELEKSAFTKRLFGVFDEDGSGEIDFNEFALSIWNFCALSKGTMGMFIFDLYDVDGSGKLTAGEVTKLVEDIFGKEEAKRNMITTM